MPKFPCTTVAPSAALCCRLSFPEATGEGGDDIDDLGRSELAIGVGGDDDDYTTVPRLTPRETCSGIHDNRLPVDDNNNTVPDFADGLQQRQATGARALGVRKSSARIALHNVRSIINMLEAAPSTTTSPSSFAVLTSTPPSVAMSTTVTSSVPLRRLRAGVPVLVPAPLPQPRRCCRRHAALRERRLSSSSSSSYRRTSQPPPPASLTRCRRRKPSGTSTGQQQTTRGKRLESKVAATAGRNSNKDAAKASRRPTGKLLAVSSPPADVTVFAGMHGSLRPRNSRSRKMSNAKRGKAFSKAMAPDIVSAIRCEARVTRSSVAEGKRKGTRRSQHQSASRLIPASASSVQTVSSQEERLPQGSTTSTVHYRRASPYLRARRRQSPADARRHSEGELQYTTYTFVARLRFQ